MSTDLSFPWYPMSVKGVKELVANSIPKEYRGMEQIVKDDERELVYEFSKNGHKIEKQVGMLDVILGINAYWAMQEYFRPIGVKVGVPHRGQKDHRVWLVINLRGIKEG